MICASPTYRKRLRERQLRASRAGVAARERNRLARADAQRNGDDDAGLEDRRRYRSVIHFAASLPC